MFFRRKPSIPVLYFSGPIGMATPLRPGLSLRLAAGAIDKAFTMSKAPAVAIVINSPGGSPVQSNLIFNRVRQLAEENDKKVYVFCEDVAASGGYYLAVAGDEIYADPSSIVGSIGVISASFGFVDAISRIGVERRVYTSGESKSQLDPFKPEDPKDIAKLKDIQSDIHEAFISVVKGRRGAKLNDTDGDLFSGAFWSSRQALEYGLIDGISDVRTKMREEFGDKIRLKPVSMGPTGLLARLKRLPGAATLIPSLTGNAEVSLADDLISSAENRAMWSRYGL